MKIKIEINCDNAAFNDYPEFEISRILQELSRDIQGDFRDRKIVDFNGNVVGKFNIIGGKK